MRKSLQYLLLLGTLFYYTTGQAQQAPSPVVQSAFQKINQGQFGEAITDLNAFLSENPNHFGALGMLGLAYRNQQAYDQSVTAYAQAMQAQPDNVRGQFNLGVAYALNNQLDESFELLLKVKQSNAFNITNIGLSPAGAILQKDARYRKLFPSDEAYAAPFSEDDVDIIYDWQGENQSDQFGWIGRNIGDVDQDGVMDLTASAPTSNEGADGAGKIYVYSGQTGALIWSYAAKDANGQLGMSIETAGDVNGDKIPDVVAGAPYVNKTWVFSGKDGKVLYEWKGEDEKAAFGRAVKGVGDVNKDGYDDVLIGAPYQIWGAPLNSAQVEDPGKVYLYSGKDGMVLQQWSGERIGDGFGTAVAGKTIEGNSMLIIGAPGAGASKTGQVQVYKGMKKKSFFTIDSDETGKRLGGMFMSVVGDVNADGTQDVYASDFTNAALGASTGRAYIHSGTDGKRLYTFTGENAGDGFGIGVADAGDTNQDGYDDLVIGAWQYAKEAPSGGKIYVYSGKDGSVLRTITGRVVGETLGFDTTNIGDVNGDGKIDLLLTSAWSGINGSQSGRMLVVAGK